MTRRKKKPAYMVRPRQRTVRKRMEYVLCDVFIEMKAIRELLQRKHSKLKAESEAANVLDDTIRDIDDVDQPLAPVALATCTVTFEKRTKRLMTRAELRDECITQLDAIIERAQEERLAISEFLRECDSAKVRFEALSL